MKVREEAKAFALMATAFIASYYLPVGTPRFDHAVMESLHLVKWYAREHVVMCLIPAFFIAGAISVFVSQAAVMKHLGPSANKWLAYGVASVSGTVLAVCSCTVLPLFGGIYRMGAGLGPASAFLYSGPAINILAIVLTARVLGPELGIARAVGAISFSVVIGLLMALIFRKEEQAKTAARMAMPVPEGGRPLWQTAVYFALMAGILVFANWGKPQVDNGFWQAIYSAKWAVTALCAIGLGGVLIGWFEAVWWKVLAVAVPVGVLSVAFPDNPIWAFAAGCAGLSLITMTSKGEMAVWFDATWGFAKQIFPLLLGGVFVAGALLGRPGEEGLIPNDWVASAVGGNSLQANFLAAIIGAFMYFATLTEVPIVQGLIGSGMGKGPALALLLAGPALSLPSMLVMHSLLGFKKTFVYCSLVVVMSTLAGVVFGAF